MADRRGPSKKSDKKARRAAKVQQKEETSSQSAAASECSESATATSGTAAGAAAAVTAGKSPRKTSASSAEQTKSGASAEGAQNSSPAGKEQPKKQDGMPETPSAKKQLTKAERRALQEAQRQAKQDNKSSEKPKIVAASASAEKKTPKLLKLADSAEPKVKQSGSKSSKSSSQSKGSSAKFFSHLPSYRSQPPVSKGYIHPCIAQIGLQYSKGVICGSNARAVALLCAFKKVVEDYETPHQKDLARDLQDKLRQYMTYLHSCRPVSVSMESVSKYITPIVLGCQTSESEAKKHLAAEIDRFYEERIRASDEQIADRCLEKLVYNDVIMTYGHSSLVLKVLVTAVKTYPTLSVIVVDSRPKFEGREMIRKLVKACPSVSYSYVLINSVSYVMPRATKVLLGAHAVLANGYIMSRAGTSQVALMARAYNVPLLVCCETYKFSHRMQTDSFVANELGDKEPMVDINGRPGPLASLEPNSNLHVLNLCYDVTPPDYVTGLITEIGVIPCTSAPVVIRVKQQFDINLKT